MLKGLKILLSFCDKRQEQIMLFTYKFTTFLLLEHEWKMDGLEAVKVVHSGGSQFDSWHGTEKKNITTISKIRSLYTINSERLLSRLTEKTPITC